LDTTNRLLDRCKESIGARSDYRLAQVLDISKTAITHWRNGRTRPDDLSVIKIAELMRRDPAAVIAELHAERAKCERTRNLWLRIAAQLSSPCQLVG
jgi:transcriptional regulator with XRE-family HTH domain